MTATDSHTNQSAGIGTSGLRIRIHSGEVHRQKNPQKSYCAKRVEVPEHIFSPFLRKNQRVGTRSALDQGVGELTAPPTNRTEEAAAIADATGDGREL